MAKKCLCTSPIPNFDGTCKTCGNLLSFETDLDLGSAPSDELSDKKTAIEELQVFTLEESLSGEIDEIISNVVGVGQSFSFVITSANVAFLQAYQRAEFELKKAARLVNADAVVAVKVSATSTMLPIFVPSFFSRQMIVLVGTAVTIKK